MKRGRASSWWGWQYFVETPEKNEAGNVKYQCQVEVDKDKEGKSIVCCELIAYSGSPTSFKTHLGGRHREWYAAVKKKEDAKKAPKKQAKLEDILATSSQSKAETSFFNCPANATELKEMDEDLLSYVVDDLRPPSSVEGKMP